MADSGVDTEKIARLDKVAAAARLRRRVATVCVAIQWEMSSAKRVAPSAGSSRRLPRW
jgi:hypothetical protein